MATEKRTKTFAPFPPEAMFDLVADVERYPEFLPHCAALRVVERGGADPQGRETLVADMVVAYRAFRETFRSRVTLDRPALRIEAEYLEGPFRHLRTVWRFEQAPDGTEIDFTISFAFSNFILQAAAAPVFEKVFMRMTDAFIRRAHDLYGSVGIES
ncbi:type II toxin-antitoxin system RatA family toxin [Amphiplicatus metriothermophilus]|uniref:Coenzyme Q-binding protein COQ10 n=1 Tax=Amphiplicatus metriothermophilus TaxID=1519374 RepID=A0A239PX14_9PROT|nr:type II toxin-antitoxin system RatA family toxin [Amphiplicatus metriothermophilus]MBB5519958.1 coenzyme Q-binding protein COQ10 [Amphiplicatus metriothermophilus]SNT74859.1 coenzyme Q-binding protein COQ10 [Amphiplicatus metriothermophilus]